MTLHITESVRNKYGSIAAGTLSGDAAGVREVAEAFGYSAEELAAIPAEANMALSCGNPTAFASLKEGETVVDLGCGGGLDVFLAARRVGPTGRAVGIDMTPEMIARARKNAFHPDGTPMENVRFHLAEIDAMPLPDNSVDCVISNCVINLAPDKQAVFREIMRILKPGGRLAVSDIALKQPLPDELRDSVAAYTGCIAGAMPVAEYEAGLKAAGFASVAIIDAGSDLNAYAQVEGQSCCNAPGAEQAAPAAGAGDAAAGGCCTPLPVAGACCGGKEPRDTTGHAAKATVHEDLAEVLSRFDVNAYAASVKVWAVKP